MGLVYILALADETKWKFIKDSCQIFFLYSTFFYHQNHALPLLVAHCQQVLFLVLFI